MHFHDLAPDELASDVYQHILPEDFEDLDFPTPAAAAFGNLAKYVPQELRTQIEEVEQFYDSLSMLQSDYIDGGHKRSTVPGSTAKEENSTSDAGCQMTVHLKYDQYQALGEILNELPGATYRHLRNFIQNGNRYTRQFQRTYVAEKCNSTTTWTDGGSISYDWLLRVSDTKEEDLESLLLGAEALLRLLCETVPNFKSSWLECLNRTRALHFWLLRPTQRNLLVGFRKPLFRSLEVKAFAGPRYWSERTDYYLATRLEGTIRLLILHLSSSPFPEIGRQPYSYLGGQVSALHEDRTNMVPTRKELPMIIGGKEIKAQHDSGAERGNFMDCDLASQLNLRLRNEKGDCKRFSMGNGKIVKALGRVKAVCAFAKEAQTKMKCWFYVFDELASPLIMGSQFLEKTITLSDHVHRLEESIPNPGIVPMVNLIGSTLHAKRRFTARIDHRYTLINADSGSDLDLMSSKYARAHGYRLDRRRRCRKRVRFADNTIAETIGQVQATLTLEDGSMYPKIFDVLPSLTSEVLLGQFTLEEISVFRFHRDSFVDVFAGERHLELSVLEYLGKVNEFLACKLKRGHRKRSQTPKQGKLLQYHLKHLGFPLILGIASLAKQQDDELMEALQARDLEAERLHLQNEGSAATTMIQERADGNGSGSEPVLEDQAPPQRRPSTTRDTCA